MAEIQVKKYTPTSSDTSSQTSYCSNQIIIALLLGQLGGRAKHFKSPGNPKSIVQGILN